MRLWSITGIAFSAAAVSTLPVLAGSLDEPIIEPAPVAPEPVVDTGGDWTGFYAGGQLGTVDIDGTGLANGIGGDDTTYGLHVGYNYDFGKWVVGGELDYDWTSVDLELGGLPIGAEVDEVWRAKLRGGYDFGRTLLYATAGYAETDTTLGSADGDFYGLGLSYKWTEQFIVSGEYLTHSFDDIGGTTGQDADADSFSLRASWQF